MSEKDPLMSLADQIINNYEKHSTLPPSNFAMPELPKSRQNSNEPWIFKGTRSRRGSAAVAPRSRRGFSTVAPRSRRGFTVVAPRSRRGFAAVAPWSRHGFAAVAPRLCHGFSMCESVE